MRNLLLALVGVLALTPGLRAEPTFRLRVGGVPVDLHGDLNAQANAMAERFLDESIAVIVLGRPTEQTRRSLGAVVDTDRLSGWLTQLSNPDSEARANAAGELDLRLPVTVDPEVALPWLEGLKRDHDRPARNATVNVESGEIVPEQHGRSVDVWATLDALHDVFASRAEHVDVAIGRTEATRTRGELDGAVFDTVLGSFDTPYNGNDRDRTHNLRVAARKIDGVVLLPGEVFDYNEVVGERNQVNGFRPATVIAGGELADGVGGGACQLAGTLHAAAYFAGLEIVERNPHSRPSSYIKLGLDAAVAWPNINFRFRNNKAFPILVRLYNRGGFTHAELRGVERNHLVSFVRRVDSFRTYGERTIEDPDLPEGVRVLSQRGVPGFEVTTWRVLRDVATNQAVRERSESSYPPTTQIWRLGTGGAVPEEYEPPAGDEHGEYRADEYLVATQGPDTDGIEHVRRAGRTGAPGWTVRQGMPPVTTDE
ncbi:MAG: VanW family protein [Myxococcota bacterium]